MDEGPLYLKVPTYYDKNKKQYMGIIHLPKAKKMIYGIGKDSSDLENDFNTNLSNAFQESYADEVFSLFKPLSYWQEMKDE
jgi:hypothetical protein